MTKHITSIILVGSFFLGIIGIVTTIKTPLSIVFDLSGFLTIVGLLGFLSFTSLRWFKKSIIKKFFASLFSIISLLIFSVVLIALIDLRILLPNTPSETLTKENWIEDFEFLDKSIQTHPAYSDSIGIIIGEYKSQIERLSEVSDRHAFIIFMKMVALLKDGHSQVMTLPLYIKQPRYLPIQTHVFEDGLYITNASRNRDLIGGQIISINNHSIETIFNKINPLIGADNPWGAKYSSGLYLLNMDVLKGLNLISSTREANLEIMIDGELITKKLKAISAIKWAIWSLAPTNEIRPVGLNIRDAKNVVEVKNDTLIWMTFNQTGPEDVLTAIGNKIHEQAYGFGINHLVIDMRNNTGGDNTTYNDLIKNLTETKIDITVLTSGKTFSAGVNFISELQIVRDFRIIGEPTGAGHNHSGDPQTMFLPNSGLIVNISTKVWDFIPEIMYNTITPNVLVRYYSTNYFNNEDPWLKKLSN